MAEVCIIQSVQQIEILDALIYLVNLFYVQRNCGQIDKKYVNLVITCVQLTTLDTILVY